MEEWAEIHVPPYDLEEQIKLESMFYNVSLLQNWVLGSMSLLCTRHPVANKL